MRDPLHLPHQACQSSSHWREVGNLPHVRFCPLHFGSHRRLSPIRFARLNLLNNRDLSDWTDALKNYPSPADRALARLNPTYTTSKRAYPACQGWPPARLGTIRECLRFPWLAAAGAAFLQIRESRTRTGVAVSGSQRLSIQCSSIAYAKSSTKVRQG